MSRLAPLSFFSPSFDSPPTAPTASSSWERDRLRSPCSQFRPANSEANVSERREDDRAGGEKGRGLRCLSRSEWPTGASPSHKEETEESGHREREDDRERKENSLQCIRGTEEELQVLAARVLQRLPYPQMLSIDDVCKEMIRLDLNVISKGLIYLSRGLPKALANSRLLFVGSKDACERELQAEEERKERERRQQQHQEDEEERRRRGVSHFTRKQPGRRRGRRTRGIEEKTKKHSCRFEEQERGNEADQEKSFSENSCCQNTASSSSTTEQETEEEGTEEDEELDDDDDDDEVEWFNTPLRDEQASCYPWLLPPRSPAPHRNIDRDGSSAKSSSSCSSPPSPTAENALYVLLRPYISPAEEVFGRGDLLVILCSFLDVRDVVNVGRVCRGTVESSLSDDVWLALLKRKFPRASLVHEDVLKDADLKTQLSANQQKEIIDALLVQIPPDAPTSLSKLLLIANRTMNQLSFSSSSDGRRSLRRTHYVLKMDIESLLHLLSCHPRLFKQDAAGEQFVVSPSLIYDDWLCVNPYAVLGGGANGSGGDPEKRKREIEEQVREDLAKEEEEQADEENEDRQKRGDSFMTGHDGDQPSGSSSASFEHEGRYLFRRDLTPRQAYRLWSTQLIGPDQNKNRPWEYHSESNHRGTLPAGHLLDLCENRVRFIRRGDPTAVHMLTVRTLEGIAYHIRTGCYNRRVNILQQALCSPHLRLEREVRKRFERKLLELMQYVKQERKFGYYQCKGCSARWRSGFTYDEIRQQCLKCFLWNKPFKLQPLLASSSSQSAGVAAATPHTPGASLSTWQNRHRHRGESHSCHSSHINNRTREEMHNSSLASPQSLYREDRTEGGNEYRRRRGGGGGINQRTLAPASPCLVDSTPEPSAGRGNEFSHGSKLNDHRKNKGISPRPFNQQRGPSFLSLAYPSLRRQEERRSGHQDGDRHNNSYVSSSSTLYSSFRSKKERQNDRRSQQDSSYTGAASSTSHRRAPEQLPGGHESRLTGAWPGQYQEARDANAKNTSVIHYKTLEEEKTHGGPSGCVGGGQTCSSHPGEGSDGSYGQTSEKTRGENGPVAHHSARGGGRRTRRLPGPPVKGVEVRGVPPRPGRQPFQENQTRHVFCEDDENGRGKITEGCGVPLLQLHEEYTSSALLNSINTEGPFKIQDSYRGDWISSHRTERQGLIATPMTIPKSSAGLLPYHPPSRHSPHHPLSPARPSTRRPLLHRGWESGGHGAGPELMHHSQPEARRQQGEEEACLFSSSLLSSSLMPSSGTLTGRDSSFCVRQQIEGRNSHSTRRGGGRGGGRGRRFLPPFTS